LSADHAARLAVDAHGEIGWREIVDRAAAVVDHRDVDGQHLDARLELRGLLAERGERGDGQSHQEDCGGARHRVPSV
jgi:hypothetical protein